MAGRLRTVVLLVAASLLACGLQPPVRTFAIVGDSVTNWITCVHPVSPRECAGTSVSAPGGALAAELQDGYSIDVRAVNGKRIDEMLPALRELAATDPQVIAEDLGSNDAAQDNQEWATSFDAMLQVMLPRRCVVLTTIASAADNYAGLHSGIAAQINRRIEDVRAANPNVRVVDWNAAVAAHGTSYAIDSVHPTSVSSQRWLASQYRAAADSC